MRVIHYSRKQKFDMLKKEFRFTDRDCNEIALMLELLTFDQLRKLADLIKIFSRGVR